MQSPESIPPTVPMTLAERLSVEDAADGLLILVALWLLRATVLFLLAGVALRAWRWMVAGL